MRSTRLLLDAAVLASISLASIVLGFWLYVALGGGDQLAVQVPAALVTGTAGMVVWQVGLRRLGGEDSRSSRLPVFLLAFPVCAVLLVVVHRVVTGYLTGFGNVAAAWSVLFLEMLIAVALVAAGDRARAAGDGAGTA